MISEGSCDTEDYSNNTENLCHYRNKYIFFKCIKIENHYLNCNTEINIFLLYIDQINAALVSISMYKAE